MQQNHAGGCAYCALPVPLYALEDDLKSLRLCRERGHPAQECTGRAEGGRRRTALDHRKAVRTIVELDRCADDVWDSDLILDAHGIANEVIHPREGHAPWPLGNTDDADVQSMGDSARAGADMQAALALEDDPVAWLVDLAVDVELVRVLGPHRRVRVQQVVDQVHVLLGIGALEIDARTLHALDELAHQRIQTPQFLRLLVNFCVCRNLYRQHQKAFSNDFFVAQRGMGLIPIKRVRYLLIERRGLGVAPDGVVSVNDPTAYRFALSR